jgi:hypothetical protein
VVLSSYGAQVPGIGLGCPAGRPGIQSWLSCNAGELGSVSALIAC